MIDHALKQSNSQVDGKLASAVDPVNKNLTIREERPFCFLEQFGGSCGSRRSKEFLRRPDLRHLMDQ
jgi:hypothetical protein